MKTAVEYLVHMYALQGAIYQDDIDKAIEMEKDQIEYAFYYGVELTKIRVESIIDEADFEDYYNENFKQ